MKASSSRLPAPRRTFWKRRGAFALSAVLGALLLAFGSRAISHFSLFSASDLTPAAVASRNPARRGKRAGSLSAALAKIDAKTIAAYVARWKNPDKIAAPGTGRAVYINTETLARRHPAWQLAAQLENGAVSPSSPRIAHFLTPAHPENLLLNSQASTQNLVPARAVPGAVVTASGALSLSPEMENRALSRFLAASAARDARRARDQAFLSRRALEDATALARRGALAELDLAVLSPEAALELLNLRLQLLRNLSRTPAQRAAARAEIAAIEARYAALLEVQTEAQAARLRAITTEIPARARRLGLQKIAREAQVIAQNQAQLRRALALENQTRLRRDFGAPDSLRLALAPFRQVSIRQFSAAKTPAASNRNAETDFFETGRMPLTSNPPLEAKSASSNARRALVARLRQQARLDAVQWARGCASRLGATWSRSNRAPDATAQALSLIFPRSR